LTGIDSGDEPPLKRARTRSEDAESTISGANSERRKSLKKPIKEGNISKSEKGKDKEKRSIRESELLDLTVDVDPPSSPIRVKWPLKKDERMHNKNVSSKL
jgi:hypothetical protein